MTSRPATVRVAGGQGFWGDWLEAPYRQVTGGPIDYLMMDYLAEVTMSILQKQKSRDPARGYATDFITQMERILPIIAERGIKVTANAGGVNARGCAMALAEAARQVGLGGKLTIGVVSGDGLLGRLDGLMARGHPLKNLDTGRPLQDVRDRVLSANAYLGAGPVALALQRGAQVVITGRVTDTGLTLGPLMHTFGWGPEAWDRIAAGTVAGHIIECGAQCSGGNCLKNWKRIPDLANVGYPIVEARADGTFDLIKQDVRSDQASGHWRPDRRCLSHRTARLRDGRSPGVHHTGWRRGLHDHPPCSSGQGQGSGVGRQGKTRD